MTKRSRKPKTPTLQVGEYVLLGGTRASYPAHWYIGKVLWADDRDVLLDRFAMNGGDTWRQTESILTVRAHSFDYGELSAIKDAAAKAVREYQTAVHDAERALGDARTALFAKLDEFAEGEMRIIPPDFDAMDAADARDRAAIEVTDAEESAA